MKLWPCLQVRARVGRHIERYFTVQPQRKVHRGDGVSGKKYAHYSGSGVLSMVPVEHAAPVVRYSAFEPSGWLSKRRLTPSLCIYRAGCPGGVSCYPRVWYRSVSRVRAPPSAYSYKFVGTFSCAQIGLRKARERELATTLDEKSTSSGIAEPYAR